MVNPLNLCERLIQSWLLADEVERLIDFEYFQNFALRNNMQIAQRVNTNGKKYYRIFRKNIHTCYISGSEINTFSFLDLSDLHIGHPDFKEKILRAKLKEAMKQEVEYVFIAGDIFEGVQKYLPYQEVLDMEYKQLDIATNIFGDYPLNYYAINGNHDYAFETFELHNPIHLLENHLRRQGINFNFFDTYIADFIVCGVAKRVMHIEKYTKDKYKPCAIERFNRFKGDETVAIYDGVEYPIRFFTCGHIHSNMELYYQRKKVFISQPGSFIQGNEKSERGIFVHGEVIGNRILRN